MNKFLIKTERCDNCGNEGIIFNAVNWDQKACWTCIQNNLVDNPTGLGWSR